MINNHLHNFSQQLIQTSVYFHIMRNVLINFQIVFMSYIKQKTLQKSRQSESNTHQSIQQEIISSEFEGQYRNKMRQYCEVQDLQIKERLFNHGIIISAKYQNHVKTILYSLAQESVLMKIHIGFFIFQISILNIEKRMQKRKERKKIGSGSFAEIFQIIYKNQSYAVKNISFRNNEKEKFLNSIVEYSFLKIASILKIGPQIKYIFGYDMIYYSDSIQFVMEKCFQTNPSLQNRKKEDLFKNLKKLHSIGLIHSDIKPPNISWSPSYKCWVFLDFGLSQIIREKIGFKTMTSFRGTYSYCSQQMKKTYFSGKKYVDLYYNDLICLQGSLPLRKKDNTFSLQFILGQEEDKCPKCTQEKGINDKCKGCRFWEDIIDFFKSKYFLFRKNEKALNEILQKNNCLANLLKEEENMELCYEREMREVIDLNCKGGLSDEEKQRMQQIDIGKGKRGRVKGRYKDIKMKQLKIGELQRKVQYQKYLRQQMKICNQYQYQKILLYYLLQCQRKTQDQQQLTQSIDKIMELVNNIYEKLDPPYLIPKSKNDNILLKLMNILYKVELNIYKQDQFDLHEQLLVFYTLFDNNEGIVRVFIKNNLQKYDELSQQQTLSRIFYDMIYIHGHSLPAFHKLKKYLQDYTLTNQTLKAKKQIILQLMEQISEAQNEQVEGILQVVKGYRTQESDMGKMKFLNEVKINENLQVMVKYNTQYRDKLISAKKHLKTYQKLHSFSGTVNVLKKSAFYRIFPTMSLVKIKITLNQQELATKHTQNILSVMDKYCSSYYLILFTVLQTFLNFRRQKSFQKFMDILSNDVQVHKQHMISSSQEFMPFVINLCMFLHDLNITYLPPKLSHTLKYIISEYNSEQGVREYYKIRIQAIKHTYDSHIQQAIQSISLLFDQTRVRTNRFIKMKLKCLLWITLLINNSNMQHVYDNTLQQLYLSLWKTIKHTYMNTHKLGYYLSFSQMFSVRLFSILVKQNENKQIYFYLFQLCMFLSQRRITVNDIFLNKLYAIMITHMSSSTKDYIVQQMYSTLTFKTIKINYVFANVIVFMGGITSFQTNANRKFIKLSITGARLSCIYDRFRMNKLLLPWFNMLFNVKKSLRKACIRMKEMFYYMGSAQYCEKYERSIRRRMRKKKKRYMYVYQKLFDRVGKVCENIMEDKQIYFQVA